MEPINAGDDVPLIFILDDEPDVVRSIAKNIAARRAAVIRSFYTAADMLASNDLARVDLFIIDIKLGGESSGFDIPGRLPYACRFAPFLFISGYAVEDKDFDKAAALPFFDFIAKPFSFVKFMHRLELLLAARSGLAADTATAADLGDLAPFVAVVLDEKLTIRLCNDQFAGLVEVKNQADLIGRNWVDFLPADLAARLIRTKGRIDLSKQGEFSIPVVSASGHVHRAIWFNTPFVGAGGRDLTLIVGVPSKHRVKMVGRLRQQWQSDILRHRAAIRAIGKMPLQRGHREDNQCQIEPAPEPEPA